MTKRLLLVLLLVLSVSLVGCSKQEAPKDTTNDKQEVANVVLEFGQNLKSVSLLAPTEVVKKSLKDEYSSLVSPELLAQWQDDLKHAPGRTTSSPWPDRIKIIKNEKKSDDTYRVQGKIIEITSEEKTSSGVAAQRPITLQVKKIGNRWLINDVKIGPYEDNTDSISYQNTKYSFNFALPDSWKGYSVITDQWEGISLEGTNNGQVIETGPIIYLRHPLWTSQKPRQDIPIMIFDLAQWNSLKHEKFSVGAAPMAPTELGRNAEFVFALPARYNYAFPTGYEEVEKILESHSLRTSA
ncbi:MAG: hypothetical protein ACM3QW_08845 [Ignavibacteriales bacterium]